MSGGRFQRARQPRALLVAGSLLPFILSSCVLAPQAQLARPLTTPRVERPASQPIPSAPRAPLEGSASRAVAFATAADRIRATVCLASAVYYEAAHEPEDGQRAVAQVVLNRMRHAEWPKTVCGVVYDGASTAGCQFSFACDGAEARRFDATLWERSRRVAERALAGEVYAPVGDATFYHTHAVAPGWRLRMIPVATIGAHIFYRLPPGAYPPVRHDLAYRGGEALPLQQATPVRAQGMPTTAAPIAASVQTPSPPRSAPLEDGDVRPEWRNSGSWIETN